MIRASSRAPCKRLQVCTRSFTDIREWSPRTSDSIPFIISAICVVRSLPNARTRLLALLSNPVLYLNVHQCLQRQRCPKLAAHVSHQGRYSTSNGLRSAGRTRVLCQVPSTGRLGTDTRRGRPKGEYPQSSKTYDAPLCITAT